MAPEPWLDSLSDDWNSQPRSSSPAASLAGGRDNGSAVFSASASHSRSHSRIPHLANSMRKDSGGSFLRHRSSRGQARQNSSSVLKERTSSSLNLPPSAGQKHSSLPRRPSHTFSDSQNSVQHHLIHGQSSRASVPEWKKRLANGEDVASDGFDLFSPSKLEGIFKEPSQLRSEDEGSFLESAPNSSAPWTLPTTINNFASFRPARGMARGMDILQEENEEDEDSEQDHSVSVANSESARDTSLRGIARSRIHSVEHPHNSESCHSSPRPSTGNTDLDSHNPNDPRWRTVSGLEELKNEFISPVTVSKQNSIRTAIMRNSADIDIRALKEKLQHAATQEQRGQVDKEGEERPGSSSSDKIVNYGHENVATKDHPTSDLLPDVTSQSLPEDLSMGTQIFASNGGFINSRRGGRSNESSFLRRTLSVSHNPTQNEVRTKADVSFCSSPPQALHRSEDIEYSRLTASEPATPPDTSIVHHDVQPVPPSSGSPLKLFGNHDTFTNNKLMRILSHFEESQDEQNRSLEESVLDGDDAGPEFRMSQFGQGELDGFGFEQNIPKPSPTAMESVDSDNRIFRKMVSQNTNFHDADLVDELLKSSVIATESPDPGHGQHEGVGKKDRETKRRKTISNVEDKTANEALEVQFSQTGDTTALAGTKRKDARPGTEGTKAEAGVLAARSLLQPKSTRRSSHSRAASGLHTESLPAEAAPLAQEDRSVTEVIAAELQSFAEGAAQAQNDSRKPSLATKDYMEEANKVMQFIRSRGKPKTNMPTLHSEPPEHSELNPDSVMDLRLDADSTKDSFSRPPSREGVRHPSPDRRHARHDSQTARYLRQYQDEDDLEVLEATSALEIFPMADNKIAHEAALVPVPEEEPDEQESSPPNIRILNHSDAYKKRKHSDSTIEGPQETVGNTQHSHGSTQHSFPTSSSTSGPKGVIPSGTVSIPDRVGAMTFDHDKNIWVRKMFSDGGASDRRFGAPTDDDPFDSIPDLSIDETREAEAAKVPIAGTRKPTIFTSLLPVQDQQESGPIPSSRSVDERVSDERNDQEDLEEVNQSSLRSKASAHEAKLYDGLPSQPPAPLGGDRKQARVVTIAFSSPLVSGVKYASLSEEDFDDLPREDDLPLDDSEINLEAVEASNNFRRSPAEEQQIYDKPERHSLQKHPQEGLLTFQPRSISPIEERDEDLQAQFSLIHVQQSSEITPMPSKTVAKLQRTGAKNSSILCLTPLSDFTIHQVDAGKHPDQSYVEERQHPNALRQAHGSLALAFDALVKAITDAVPDELFWEQLPQLSLAGKGLSSLHGLSDYCSSLGELAVSDNQVVHLNGLPNTLRNLDIRNNLLNDLTSWGHLQNLQYIELSGNQLESLEGFGSLVHLRSLRANNNMIKSIDGILDLSGLLDLQLRNNDLKAIDFEGAELYRLRTLDLSSNQLVTVQHLECLPGLEELDLSHNNLKHCPLDALKKTVGLQKLQITHNELQSLELCNMPSLGLLDLDNNRIQHIGGLSTAYKLENLSVRQQSESFEIVDFVLSTPNECRKICLSANPVKNGSFNLPEMPQNNLRELEIAACGIVNLPWQFGSFFPNCRMLNANFNAVQEISDLRGMVKLKQLFLAKNRISRLRRTCLVLAKLISLDQVDLRDNPLTVGFYSPVGSVTGGEAAAEGGYQLADGSPEGDVRWAAGLDEVTRLRRRTIELLLTEHCRNLLRLDGLDFKKEARRQQDETWDRLNSRGVLCRMPLTPPPEVVQGGADDTSGSDVDAKLNRARSMTVSDEGGFAGV